MAKVFNWQLNREMDYPLEGARPQKQFAAVFDINKCIACQTCTVACKNAWTTGRGQEFMFWNNVETKPYGFYPLGWDARLLDSLEGQSWNGNTYTGKTVFEAAPRVSWAQGFLPEEADWASPNLGEDEIYGKVDAGTHLALTHIAWSFYLQRVCNHCTYPACLASCPRSSIYKRPEDGIVLVDQTRCRGYRECNKACPYKKVMYNAVTHVSEKCIACFPLIEQGRQTYCMMTCIGRIRMGGWIHTPDKVDPENPVDFLVHVRKVALPLYPQFGTEANIYYIPPKHVPTPFLKQMFGPGVDQAIATYNKAADDPDLLGVLLLMGSTDKWIERFKVKDGIAYGFDAKGAEITRVPLKEPIFIRPYFDTVQKAYRHNIT